MASGPREASPGPRAPSCPNCGASAGQRFCPACGQRQTPFPRPLWRVLGELLGEAIDLDGRVARTIVPFLVRPGVLTAEYNAGRRMAYTSPIRIFLFMTLLLLLAIGGARPDEFGEVRREVTPGQGITFHMGSGSSEGGMRIPAPDQVRVLSDSPVGEGYRRGYERLLRLPPADAVALVYDAMAAQTTKVALVALPLFAAWLWLLHVVRRRYFVEHVVFTLHFFSFAFLAVCVDLWFPSPVAALATLVVITVYFVLALRRAFDQPLWLAALKGLVSIIAGGLLVGMAIVLTALLAISGG